jgi:hypothetical protein
VSFGTYFKEPSLNFLLRSEENNGRFIHDSEPPVSFKPKISPIQRSANQLLANFELTFLSCMKDAEVYQLLIGSYATETWYIEIT